MKTVQILLATYNGENHLKAQIESLIQQTYQSVSILVRDDGSTDSTSDILHSYSDQDILSWIAGKNVGVIRCFSELLKSAPLAFCYAYCDQDDIWLPDKLERAVKAIESCPADTPVLYFTSTNLVDEQLNSLNQHQPYIARKVDFGNALVQNVVTGCTLVMNHASRELILSVEPNWENVRMHDWWTYIVIAAHGKVIYDPIPSIDYRQHTTNQVGMSNITLRKRIERFWRHDQIITRQAEEFYKGYHETIPDKQGKILDKFISSRTSLIQRLQLALDGQLYRQRIVDDIIFKILLILNRL